MVVCCSLFVLLVRCLLVVAVLCIDSALFLVVCWLLRDDCVLFVVRRRLSCVEHCSLFDVLLFVCCFLLLNVFLFVACWLLLYVQCSLFVFRCSFVSCSVCVVCCLLCVACRLLFVACRECCVACRVIMFVVA